MHLLLLRKSLKVIKFVSFCLILFFVGIQNLKIVSGEDVPPLNNLATSSFVNNGSNLEEIIRQKTSELQQVEKQRQILQDQLSNLSLSKNSLSKEVQSLNYQIDQLNLEIKANQLTIERLNLEIQSSSLDIQNTEQQIVNTKQTIAKLMLEAQQKSDQSLLYIILSEKTLGNILNEIDANYLLRQQLLENVKTLSLLEKSLTQKIAEADQKKSQKEVESINLINSQNILQNQKEIKNDLLSQTKNQEKIYESQLEKLEEQQLAISQVIEKIESQLRANFNPNLLPTPSKGIFSFPVPLDNLVITQTYGYTKFAEKAYRTNFHTGVDFRAPMGTPIYAAADGVVFRVDNNDSGISRFRRHQYGKYILIKHSNNLTTLYAHLSKQIVKEGDIIKRGQLIGYAGATGYAFGPHLHFGVYYTPNLELKSIPPANGLVPVGVTADPMLYLPKYDF